jgi:hypothetical protein
MAMEQDGLLTGIAISVQHILVLEQFMVIIGLCLAPPPSSPLKAQIFYSSVIYVQGFCIHIFTESIL